MTNRASEASTLEFEVGGDHQDELFKVLSHPRRRFTLQYLQIVETPLPVDELTTELGVWEDQRTGVNEPRGERPATKISLVHNHLPRMADAGVISYDTTRQTVMLADGADEVDAHLQTMTDTYD